MAAESHRQQHDGSLPASCARVATRWALSLPTSPLCSSCQTPSAQISPACLTCPPPAAAAAALVEEERRHHLLWLHTVERVEVVVLPLLTQSVHIQHPHHHTLFIQIPDPSCGSTHPCPYTHTHTPPPPSPLPFFCPPPNKILMIISSTEGAL